MEPQDTLRVFDEFYTRIFRYVLGRVGDAEVARDITAEVFFKMIRSRLRLRLTRAPVSAWLFRVAGNEIATFHRRRKYRPVQLEAALNDSGALPPSLCGDLRSELSAIEEAVNRNDMYLKVHRGLVKLPDKYQEVIVLHYLEGQTVPEIALLLGKREGTVKSLISRGIAKLKQTAVRQERRGARGDFSPMKAMETE